MREYQHKRKVKKITSSIWFAGIILFLTLILLSSVLGLYQKKRQVMKLSQESRTELENLEEKTGRVSSQLETLGSAHGKEQMIREKYNVKTQGEGVIIVMDEQTKDTGVSVVKNNSFHSIKSFFKHLIDSVTS